ncbi:MAG: MFS transporter [Clostridiales bacterium]|jgi:Na+/melibiose symporter-like transporter|nr:MFS transporter [Clostridiales bacterium]
MNINFSNIKQKSSDFITDFREYWTKPPKGNYISYKEIGAYSLGGIGKMLIGMLAGYLTLSATNTLIGSVIGLSPVHIQLMNIVLGFLNAVFTIIRGMIVDNTRTRWGRFRPYIALMGIPMVFLTTIFVFLPFDSMRSYNIKLMWTFLFAVSLSFISPFFNDTYTELRTVMSPNTQERSMLIAVSSIIASAAPTITNMFVPILVEKMGTYTSIAAYRAIFVPLGIVGLFFTLFTAFGTKERVFVSKQYKPKIRTLHAMGQIYRNKYWWIRTIATWTAFLEGGITSLFMWIFIYHIQNYTLYAAVMTINGAASGIAMFITPYIIKKIGPRNLMIFQNLLNIVFISLMSIFFKIPAFFFMFNFISLFVYEFSLVGDPVIHSEVKDYSHYQSGRRMDFLFGTAGIIGLPLTTLTGIVIPLIYESAGLTNNYDILFDPAVRNSMFATLCIVSVIGSAINLVPYLFYDLSETKHRNIIKVLRLRNMFEDYIGNDLSPRDIKLCVEEIREAREYIVMEKIDTAGYIQKLKEAKLPPALSDEQKKIKKEAVKAARHELSEAKNINLNIDSAQLVIEELVKYESGQDAEKLALARQTLEWGFDGIKNLDKSILEEAKNSPKDNDDQKHLRNFKIRRARLLLSLKKSIVKDKLQEINTSELEAAYCLPETTKEEINLKLKAVSAARKILNKYSLAAEAYMAAQALIKDAEAYGKLAEIEARYDEACRDVDEQDRLDKEKRDAAKKAKQDDLERIRREKRERRDAKKGGKA